VTLLVLHGSHKGEKAAGNFPALHLAVTPSAVRVGGAF
jgi:hypothetical protein